MFKKTIRDPNVLKNFLDKLDEDSDENNMVNVPNEKGQSKLSNERKKLFFKDEESEDKLKASQNYFFKKTKKDEEMPHSEKSNKDNFIQILKSRSEITALRRKSSMGTGVFEEKKILKLLNLDSTETKETPKLMKQEISSPVQQTSESKNKFEFKKEESQGKIKNLLNPPTVPTQVVEEEKPCRNLNVTRELSEHKDVQKLEISTSKPQTPIKKILNSTYEAKPRVLILNSPKRRDKFNKKSVYSQPNLSQIEDTCDFTCAKDIVDMAYLSWYKKKTTELIEQKMTEKKLKEIQKTEDFKRKSELETTATNTFTAWKRNADLLVLKKQRERKAEEKKLAEKEQEKKENVFKSEKSFAAWLEKKKSTPKPKEEKEKPKAARSAEEVTEIENKRRKMEKRFQEQQLSKKKLKQSQENELKDKENKKLRKEMEAQKNFEDWLDKKENTFVRKSEPVTFGPWIPPRRTIPFNK